AVLAVLTALALGACTASPAGGLTDGGAGADAASDACAASDADGDGFGTDPSCPARDCDDTNLAIHPGAPEACNGLDEDCDDAIDEDLGSTWCGQGVCRRLAPNCVDGRPAPCTSGQGVAETCNGVDDDCDGVTDEDVPAASCGVGACARTAACTGGVMGACVPGDPAPETCNRADDDCDGEVDEGSRSTVVNGTYTMLRAFHGGCDGAAQRMGTDCNAAMHRYCAQAGCTTTGFGPLENSGDVAIFACVVAAPGRDVPFATLASFHGPCDGAGQRVGPDCNAAIHRYCASEGFVSGFGPAELGVSTALVTCLAAPHATVIGTTYSVLVTHHDGCNATTRYGPPCNAAISRFCASQGFTTGYGPVENSGDTAVVTCVAP
ncbi:putative metal-binding motif-containing protein, partial [Myxococcota bacterium]|nr:putative metal-binding motif-containing protein [Myxococcota bacterium]